MWIGWKRTYLNISEESTYLSNVELKISLPFLLHLARVNDIYHVVNGYRGLSDIGGDDDLGDTLWGPAENCLLLLIGQG